MAGVIGTGTMKSSFSSILPDIRSFASLSSNIRNLSRQIWVSVVVPAPDNQDIKGKALTSNITATQLRRRKVEALKLALSFAYAVKHYLRGEDGTKWEDFSGVLPPSFDHFDEIGFNVEHTTPRSYSAARNDVDNAEGGSGASTPELERPKPDATKRVRRKRSKQLSGALTPATPLLGSTHRTVEFYAYADEASLPLPLV
ncbi:hypothetical protein H0H87_001584 [Tephrocybe sp. NHM501043]|nr:hypothetical protein H0H87_001584 [Tephrocybe sp. NHM501043]